MLNPNQVPDIEEIRRKVEEYETTIIALRALSRVIVDYFRKESPNLPCHVSYGRRMDTSTNNRIHPNNTATPDTVLQIGEDWGLVVEAKRSMPQNQDNRWHKTVNQLCKYDDRLKGWWTESGELEQPNITLLIDVDRSVDFSQYLQTLLVDNEFPHFQNPTSIIEFFKKQEVKQFLRIRQIWGQFEPTQLSHELKRGKSVPVEGIIDGQRFYDQEPEAIEYTMVLLWQNVFTEKRTFAPFDEKQRAWLIKIDLDELTEYMQQLYGNRSNEPRERTYPQKKWIQKALEAFILLDLANRSGEKNKYTIKYKKFRGGDIFQRFHKHREISLRKAKKSEVCQLELFPSTMETSEVESSLEELSEQETE